MPTYVTLAHWTDQGIKNIKEMNQRADAASDLLCRLGGQLKEVYDHSEYRPLRGEDTAGVAVDTRPAEAQNRGERSQRLLATTAC